ncbi:unnamed protein product [Owenia fusiformis]|uniref:Spc7 kinetochore protein domain-containing protein n=1 Tax=Owenia fusiformis TaxID=6347 RepID=A0A8S4PEV1_OWEFU|nr:unnamed protein product [Owenia fusiformis]
MASHEGETLSLGGGRKRKSNNRRSSILKMGNRSPSRGALYDIDPNAPAQGDGTKEKKTRMSRRVSFAETNQVKEFVKDASWHLNHSNDPDHQPTTAQQDNAENKGEVNPPKISGLDSLLTGHIQHSGPVNTEGEPEHREPSPVDFQNVTHNESVQMDMTSCYGNISTNQDEDADNDHMSALPKLDASSFLKKLAVSSSNIEENREHESSDSQKSDMNYQSGADFMSDQKELMSNHTQIFGTGGDMEMTSTHRDLISQWHNQETCVSNPSASESKLDSKSLLSKLTDRQNTAPVLDSKNLLSKLTDSQPSKPVLDSKSLLSKLTGKSSHPTSKLTDSQTTTPVLDSKSLLSKLTDSQGPKPVLDSKSLLSKLTGESLKPSSKLTNSQTSKPVLDSKSLLSKLTGESSHPTSDQEKTQIFSQDETNQMDFTACHGGLQHETEKPIRKVNSGDILEKLKTTQSAKPNTTQIFNEEDTNQMEFTTCQGGLMDTTVGPPSAQIDSGTFLNNLMKSTNNSTFQTKINLGEVQKTRSSSSDNDMEMTACQNDFIGKVSQNDSQKTQLFENGPMMDFTCVGSITQTTLNVPDITTDNVFDDTAQMDFTVPISQAISVKPNQDQTIHVNPEPDNVVSESQPEEIPNQVTAVDAVSPQPVLESSLNESMDDNVISFKQGSFSSEDQTLPVSQAIHVGNIDPIDHTIQFKAPPAEVATNAPDEPTLTEEKLGPVQKLLAKAKKRRSSIACNFDNDHTEAMDFTTCVGGIAVNDPNKELNPVERLKKTLNRARASLGGKTDTMDFTTCVGGIDTAKKSRFDATKLFTEDDQMEFTACVGDLLNSKPTESNVKGWQATKPNTTAIPDTPDKTAIFDKSALGGDMEMTEAIPAFIKTTSELTEADKDKPTALNTMDDTPTELPDKTTIFNRTSDGGFDMDFTQAITGNIQVDLQIPKSKARNRRLNRTSVGGMDMEMTQAFTGNIQTDDKTQIFDRTTVGGFDMEMTQAVTGNIQTDLEIPKKIDKTSEFEKTSVDDFDMDITKPTEKHEANDECNGLDKTSLGGFDMEMTQAVTANIQSHGVKPTTNTTHTNDKTQIFDRTTVGGFDMEMTQAVTANIQSHGVKPTTNTTHTNDKTQIFDRTNVGGFDMEMTQAFTGKIQTSLETPTGTSPEKLENHNKTSGGLDMEMTEAIPLNINAHIEANNTHIGGSEAHIEASNAHIEANNTYIKGSTGHTEANNTYIKGSNAHIEANNTYVKGSNAHVEANNTHVEANNTHIEQSLMGKPTENTSSKSVEHRDTTFSVNTPGVSVLKHSSITSDHTDSSIAMSVQDYAEDAFKSLHEINTAGSIKSAEPATVLEDSVLANNDALPDYAEDAFKSLDVVKPMTAVDAATVDGAPAMNRSRHLSSTFHVSSCVSGILDEKMPEFDHSITNSGNLDTHHLLMAEAPGELSKSRIDTQYLLKQIGEDTDHNVSNKSRLDTQYLLKEVNDRLNEKDNLTDTSLRGDLSQSEDILHGDMSVRDLSNKADVSEPVGAVTMTTEDAQTIESTENTGSKEIGSTHDKLAQLSPTEADKSDNVFNMDMNLSVEEFLSTLNVQLDIPDQQASRYSITPIQGAVPETMSDCLNIMSIVKPQQEIYSTYCKELEEKAKLIQNANEQMVAELSKCNPPMFAHVKSASTEQLQTLSDKLTNRLSLLRKMVSKKFRNWKVSMINSIEDHLEDEYTELSTCVLQVRDIQNKVTNARSSLDTVNAELDKKLQELESNPLPNTQERELLLNNNREIKQLKRKLTATDEQHAKQKSEIDTLKKRREILADETERLRIKVEKLNKAKHDSAHVSHLKEMVDTYQSIVEWELLESTSYFMKLGLLHRSIHVELTLGKCLMNKSREILDLKITSKLNEFSSANYAKLVNRLVLRDLSTIDISQLYNHTGNLPQLLQHMSRIVCRHRQLGDQLRAVEISHSVHLQDYSVCVYFSSVSSHCKFYIKFDVTQGCSWTFNNSIGNTSQCDIDSTLNKIKKGPDYLQRLVNSIDNMLL